MSTMIYLKDPYGNHKEVRKSFTRSK